MNAFVDVDFWRGKRVFLTGHTGFKGSWLSLWLASLGADVKGFSLAPPTDPSLFTIASVDSVIASESGDIRDLTSLANSMSEYNPDIVIHMAAQSLVRLSYDEPVSTYATNVMGTVHVLEAARACNRVRAIVVVTTDKCYENREWVWGYREHEPMGGYDPYSNSKGCAELVVSAYRQSFFSGPNAPAIASARAGNVIGGGDWAKDRLIPDILRAFEKNQAVIVRNPLSIRPWQHVLEPLSGYLMLAQQLWHQGHTFADAWNFGPRDQDAKPVEWILNQMVKLWGQEASWQLDSNAHPHEASYLKLDISKAQSQLHWAPNWSLSDALEKIVAWHRVWLANGNMQDYCLKEIGSYMVAMKSN